MLGDGREGQHRVGFVQISRSTDPRSCSEDTEDLTGLLVGEGIAPDVLERRLWPPRHVGIGGDHLPDNTRRRFVLDEIPRLDPIEVAHDFFYPGRLVFGRQKHQATVAAPPDHEVSSPEGRDLHSSFTAVVAVGEGGDHWALRAFSIGKSSQAARAKISIAFRGAQENVLTQFIR